MMSIMQILVLLKYYNMMFGIPRFMMLNSYKMMFGICGNE